MKEKVMQNKKKIKNSAESYIYDYNISTLSATKACLYEQIEQGKRSKNN